jgi:serine/threonine protein kinase
MKSARFGFSRLVLYFLITRGIVGAPCKIQDMDDPDNMFEIIRKTEDILFGEKSDDEMTSRDQEKEFMKRRESQYQQMCTSYVPGLNQSEKNPSDWRILGTGSFGKVFEVKIENMFLAVKYISFRDYFKETWQLIVSENKYNFSKNESNHVLLKYFAKFHILESFIQEKFIYVKSINSIIWQEIIFKESQLSQAKVKLAKKISIIILSSYIDMLNDEKSVGFLIGASSFETNSGQMIAAKHFECFVTEKFEVYFVMEKLGSSLNDVRNNCPGLMGSEQIIERSLFFTKLLFNLHVLHSYGVTHCDHKLANILLDIDPSSKNVYIADFGISTITVECNGGTLATMPPEYLYKQIRDPGISETYFNTKLISQFDAYSIGMVLAYFQITFDKYKELLKMKETILNKYNRLDKNLDKKIVKEEFDTFHNTLFDSPTMKEYFSFVKGTVTDNGLNLAEMINLVISKLLLTDSTSRYPVPVAMFAFFKIYECAKYETSESCKELKRLLEDDEKMRNHLIDSIEENPKDHWTKTSQVFVDTFHRIRELTGKNIPNVLQNLLI